jgi:alpha-galactosidase
MKPNFSFDYNSTRFFANEAVGCSVTGGTIYELESGICVYAEHKLYPSFNAVEWVLYFENKTDKDSGIFSNILDCDTLLPLSIPAFKRPGYMPKEGDPCVITMNGCIDGNLYCENDEKSATEFNIYPEYLGRAGMVKTFQNHGGRSSDGTVPIFDVTASGAGYITAIGWTGDWRATFTVKDDGVFMQSGLKETNFYLKPGEKLRTTSVLIMPYGAGEDKHNKFRRLIREHFSHKAYALAQSNGLMACELWGGISSFEMKKRITEFKEHGVFFEQFWIDAGWYGECQNCEDTFSGDWSRNTGNWMPNTRVHPDGLADVSACAQEAGAGLMLWLEIERAILGTPITEEHPEWFLEKSGDRSRILNLGNEEAFSYAVSVISGHIDRLKMTCFRQDSNAELTAYFASGDTPDRRGITEIKHIMGQYRLWDTLLAKYPGLMIDNCASGGRRIDIEALKRTVLFFRSDYQCNFNENPEVLQTHNANTSLYFPYMGCTSKTKSDTYAIRSSFSASWGAAFYNTVFQGMDEADFAWAKQITEEYRRIRHYFSEDFYNHGSSVFDSTSWAIWQYHDPRMQSGILMAFRRSASPFDRVELSLRGLLDGRSYIYENLNDGSTEEHSSSLTVCLPEKRSSIIYLYTLQEG